MKITILCNDKLHPVIKFVQGWISRNSDDHDISLVHSKDDLDGGDILFLVSCSEIISSEERAAYGANLILHASALPNGRGWSPLVWQIIQGAEEITLSLLEAEDAVDSGRIWHQITFPVAKHALWDEINEQLFNAEIDLIDYAIKEFNKVNPAEQDEGIDPTYFPRRTPSDSKIDPELSIASQFDLIRISDPKRFPAHFYLHGFRYKLILEKFND
jgi:methionyl-tRNA formyltransferase